MSVVFTLFRMETPFARLRILATKLYVVGATQRLWNFLTQTATDEFDIVVIVFENRNSQNIFHWPTCLPGRCLLRFSNTESNPARVEGQKQAGHRWG